MTVLKILVGSFGLFLFSVFSVHLNSLTGRSVGGFVSFSLYFFFSFSSFPGPEPECWIVCAAHINRFNLSCSMFCCWRLLAYLLPLSRACIVQWICLGEASVCVCFRLHSNMIRPCRYQLYRVCFLFQPAVARAAAAPATMMMKSAALFACDPMNDCCAMYFMLW